MKNIAHHNDVIEIQTYHLDENTRNEISTSRINLLQAKKNKDVGTKKTELTIKNEFRAFCAITNLKKVMIFVYICLAFDFTKNLYQAYLMTYTLMDILELETSVIYLLRYSTSLFNAVGLLKIIIVYKDYADEKKKKKNNLNKKRAGDGQDASADNKSLDVDFELTVPMPVKAIKGIRSSRLIVWFINTLLFIIVVVINKSMNVHDYLDILLNINECFLLHLMRFYYSVLIRIEAYKEVYDLKEN